MPEITAAHITQLKKLCRLSAATCKKALEASNANVDKALRALIASGEAHMNNLNHDNITVEHFMLARAKMINTLAQGIHPKFRAQGNSLLDAVAKGGLFGPVTIEEPEPMTAPADAPLGQLQRLCTADRAKCQAALKAAKNDVDKALRSLLVSGKVTATGLDPDLASNEHYALALLYGRLHSQFFSNPKARKALGISDATVENLRNQLTGKKRMDQAILKEAAASHAEFLQRAHPKNKKNSAREFYWTHPSLGRFRYELLAWEKAIRIPAFKAFSSGRGAPETYKLSFDVNDKRSFPTAAATRTLDRILANAKELVAKTIHALWEDFNGRGPNSRMWWRANLNKVIKHTDTNPRIAAPEDILPLLRLQTISVRRITKTSRKPLVELSFHAAFEREHGLGVLTDGNEILGIGYILSVEPYRKSKRKK